MSFPVKQLVKKIDKLAFFVLEVSYITIACLGGFTHHKTQCRNVKAMLVSQVDLDIGDHHMENNQGVTSKDFDKFFSWRGEISDW